MKVWRRIFYRHTPWVACHWSNCGCGHTCDLHDLTRVPFSWRLRAYWAWVTKSHLGV